jgi:hypothetical protein
VIGDYTISACNVGASKAGTGSASYGSFFQWGNNYRFASVGGITVGIDLVDASDY